MRSSISKRVSIAYYVGERAINPLNQAFAPSYTLYDVGLGYATTVLGNETHFQVNGENITDKRYFSSTGAFLLAQGGPRMVKFSVTTKF